MFDGADLGANVRRTSHRRRFIRSGRQRGAAKDQGAHQLVKQLPMQPKVRGKPRPSDKPAGRKRLSARP